MYLANAFSLNMLAGNAEIYADLVDVNEAKVILADGFVSAIGHGDTAAVVGSDLGMVVGANRISVSLSAGDEIIVAQYTGPRLPEGATHLPDGAAMKYWHVRIR